MDERALLVQPMPVVHDLAPYSVGRPDHHIDLVLDFNESLESAAALPIGLNRYPELPPSLENELADRLAVAPERVLLTCGADDALERAVRAVCGPGRTALLTSPTYGMISRFVQLAGAEIAEVPWWCGDLPVAELLAAADQRTALVAVVTPSNPTGAAASVEALRKLLEGLPRALVIVDQAYVDFAAPELNLAPLALTFANAVVIRTFSKAWGAAGLRVGFALGDARVIDWMRRVGLPFPVSRPAAELIGRALEVGADRERISTIQHQRAELIDVLTELGAEPWESEASFVLARFDHSQWVWNGLAALGIAVRRFSGRPALDSCLRITLPGDAESFDRLARALRTVLAPEALLFDLDGVLADVSGSYRRAIIETAAGLGVRISPADVARAKATGNANNDWKLTRTLLADRGVEADLDEITNRFEALYQGDHQRPGLHANESLLPAPGAIEALAARLPLAVVTGRPRSDAERFLADSGIGGFFSSVVCMEDAPAKPDPAPVHLALERLGVERAWMLGDTPDDLIAARRADVLPLGIVAPGEDPQSTSRTLQRSGAAGVLDSIQELREVLP